LALVEAHPAFCNTHLRPCQPLVTCPSCSCLHLQLSTCRFCRVVQHRGRLIHGSPGPVDRWRAHSLGLHCAESGYWEGAGLL